MNTQRTALIAAVLLALGTGWMTLNYINGIKRASTSEQRTVVVTTQDIPARVAITPSMVRLVRLPAAAVDSDAYSDTSRVDGQLTLITIPAGGEVTASKIGTPATTALPVRIAPGKRAVSIQVDRVKGVSGLLQPGDRVDIIAIPPRTGNQPPPASTILRGVRVLAVGETLETASATPSPEEESSTTVTLELTPSQVDLIAMADQNTTLRLALRSPKEAIDSEPTEALHFPDGSVQQTQVAAAPAPAPVAKIDPVRPTLPVEHGIMMIVGDRVSYGTAQSQGAQDDGQ